MSALGYGCDLHSPKALSGPHAHNLPPYALVPAHLVDAYPNAPDNWMRSEGKRASYFVGIEEGTGMWLDFNSNWSHPEETAILISVQGVNPLDGLKSDGKLAKYSQCPVHRLSLHPADRHCPQCGFAWPAQNFLSTSGTPIGQLWIDGFRSSDGQTRQFLFTAEEMRGIAAQVIGEQRCFSIGIAFFSGPKRRQPTLSLRSYGGTGTVNYSGEVSYGASAISAHCDAPSDLFPVEYSMSFERPRGITTKSLEIAAGASINQHIHGCVHPLEAWNAEPDALIYVNYAPKAFVDAMMKDHLIHRAGSFLDGLRVGN